VQESTGWRREASLELIVSALPETLAEAVSRQLDQLDPSEREVLEAASVVGLEFNAGSVALALGRRIEQVRLLLGPLARRGQLIVHSGANGSRGAQDAYRFRHALYAEVVSERAPMLRQLRVAERFSQARDVTLRRA
jgi:predicted ATPase